MKKESLHSLFCALGAQACLILDIRRVLMPPEVRWIKHGDELEMVPMTDHHLENTKKLEKIKNLLNDCALDEENFSEMKIREAIYGKEELC